MLPHLPEDYDLAPLALSKRDRIRMLIWLAFVASCCFAWAL